MVGPKFFCIREAVDDVLQGLLCVDEKGAVVSRQRLSDEFLDGFRACEETPKVEETAVNSETDVDASGGSSFASRSMMLKKMENNVGARTHPCSRPLEIGKLPDRDPLCLS